MFSSHPLNIGSTNILHLVEFESPTRTQQQITDVGKGWAVTGGNWEKQSTQDKKTAARLCVTSTSIQ